MAKLANAPVYFTIGQVRHNPLLKLEQFVPSIQEAMRHAGYPDYRVTAVRTLVLTGSPGDQNAALPTFEQPARYTFLSSDLTRAFVLFPNSISFETTRYDTSTALRSELMKGLRLVRDIVGGFDYVDRIGLRYLDAVSPGEGETVRDYVNPEFHGVVARMPDVGLQYSFSESRLVADGVGAVVARVLFQRSTLAVPPDLSIDLKIEDRFLKINGEHALLDTDGSWETREPFDVDAIDARFQSIHRLMTRVFQSIASPHALERWK
jgi:uncharacterized protein (TIGR04255 family)